MPLVKMVKFTLPTTMLFTLSLTEKGPMSKAFETYDGGALWVLQNQGMDICLLMYDDLS